MVKVDRASSFRQALEKLCFENEEFLVEANRTIKLFQQNPKDTRLDNHRLRKRLNGKWAFSVTDDIRIVYKLVGKNSVRFLTIGTHREVYIPSTIETVPSITPSRLI